MSKTMRTPIRNRMSEIGTKKLKKTARSGITKECTKIFSWKNC